MAILVLSPFTAVETTTLKVTGGTVSAGQVLTADTAGNATWQTPAAGGAAQSFATTMKWSTD